MKSLELFQIRLERIFNPMVTSQTEALVRGDATTSDITVYVLRIIIFLRLNAHRPCLVWPQRPKTS